MEEDIKQLKASGGVLASKKKTVKVDSDTAATAEEVRDDEASRDVEEVIIEGGKVSQMVEREIPDVVAETPSVKMVSKGIQVEVQPPPYRCKRGLLI